MVMAKGLSTKENLVPLELYKLTPKTNCGDCGYPSCLAFATHVVKGEISVDKCIHMDKSIRETVAKRVAAQRKEGYGLKMRSFDFVREDFRKVGVKEVAKKHGLPVEIFNEVKSVVIPYLNDIIYVSENDIVSKSGRSLTEQEKMFIYNYLLRGEGDVKGRWVGMEGLPGSISKVKSLRAHCEEPLLKTFRGRLDKAREIGESIGARVVDEGGADLGLLFQVLPKLPVLILFWDHDPEDNFPGRVKFLYDEGVLNILDLESLTFASEQLTELLLNQA